MSVSELALAIGIPPRSTSNVLNGNHHSRARRISIENELKTSFWSSEEEFEARQVRLGFYGCEVERRNIKELRSFIQAVGAATPQESKKFSRSQLIGALSEYAIKEIAAGRLHLGASVRPASTRHQPVKKNPKKQ